MVTASRVGLQVRDQDSASAVEEPSVWVHVLVEGEGQDSCSQHPSSLWSLLGPSVKDVGCPRFWRP